MKKLTLNKKTITNLNNEDLNNVIGGQVWYTNPKDCGPSENNNTCNETSPNLCGGGGSGLCTEGNWFCDM